jgi:hypothetical protein
MAPKERSEIVNALEQSREFLVTAAAGVPESQAGTKPEPGRWSVVDCVEHVTTVEEIFLDRLKNAERLAALNIDKQKEADLAARVVNRETRIQAPEMIHPKGRFTTLAQALEGFNAARKQTIQFAEDKGEDLYWLAAAHPRFGSMNGNEVMVIIAAHARRHAAQIREVQATLGAHS